MLVLAGRPLDMAASTWRTRDPRRGQGSVDHPRACGALLGADGPTHVIGVPPRWLSLTRRDCRHGYVCGYCRTRMFRAPGVACNGSAVAGDVPVVTFEKRPPSGACIGSALARLVRDQRAAYYWLFLRPMCPSPRLLVGCWRGWWDGVSSCTGFYCSTVFVGSR
jgi:hypothetical protein